MKCCLTLTNDFIQVEDMSHPNFKMEHTITTSLITKVYQPCLKNDKMIAVPLNTQNLSYHKNGKIITSRFETFPTSSGEVVIKSITSINNGSC